MIITFNNCYYVNLKGSQAGTLMDHPQKVLNSVIWKGKLKLTRMRQKIAVAGVGKHLGRENIRHAWKPLRAEQ